MVSSPEPRIRLSRALNVALAVVIGAAAVGFLAGTKPLPKPAAAEAGSRYAPEGNAMPGQPYWALRDRRYGLNARPTSDLGRLVSELPSPADEGFARPAERAVAVAARATRRAYDGAPPTVPHVIDQISPDACIVCHDTGMVVKGLIAPAMSHEYHSSCTQCHAGTVPREHVIAPAVDNGFEGVVSYGAGDRAWDGAPPTIPHPTAMRSRCSACHGVTGQPGLRTPHVDRRNCVQCHIPAQQWAQWMSSTPAGP